VRLRELFITGLRSAEQFPLSAAMQQQWLLYGQQFSDTKYFLYLFSYLCHVKPYNGIKWNLQHRILTQNGTTLNFVSCRSVTATTLHTDRNILFHTLLHYASLIIYRIYIKLLIVNNIPTSLMPTWLITNITQWNLPSYFLVSSVSGFIF
jgi:hypothetical protein